jgi:hypothetical protein
VHPAAGGQRLTTEITILTNKMAVVDRALEDQSLQRVYIKVTNENNFPIVDMYDSVVFEFEPSKPKTIPAEAAAHIFGWRGDGGRDAMFMHSQKRWGWNTPEYVSSDKARKYFERIKIEQVIFRLVEMTQEEMIEPAGDATATTEPDPNQQGAHDPRAPGPRAAGKRA